MKQYNSLTYMYSKETISKLGCSVSTLALIVGSSLCLSYCTQDTVDVKIVDKYIKTEQSGKSSKGVFYVVGEKKSGEREVFKNADSLAFLKFNSSDIQQQIDMGKTYRLDVNWMRMPFFSMYRNIINADLIKSETTATASQTKPKTLEANYAQTLLQMINENPNADVAEAIKAFTALEAAKDTSNASKIKVIGNKYYNRYMEADTLEDFKQLLVEASSGKKVVQCIQQGNQQLQPVLFALRQNSHQHV
ncbi:MAG: hypothetical protein IKJ28_06960 [Alphaproteobacteria bacterium]|nr:hypothetical protein [Alphaproteobacteria bacterium]